MEVNKEEAFEAIAIAEKRFAVKDFAGAKNYALKAKTLYPGLEGISQMVATFEVYIASEVKCNGEADYYSILGLKPSADKETVKKQYKKMAVLLHPDKNKCVGADGAFKLVSEAWTLLSDGAKRKSHDIKRKTQNPAGFNQTNLSPVHAAGVPGYCSSNLSASCGRLDTFWTICTSCKVQYEYLRKYLNKRLSCKNCRGTFTAVETGTAPATGSFPYTPWSYVPGNGYGSHSFDGVTTYVPNSATLFNGNGVSAYHSGLACDYVSNVSFQWSSLSGSSGGIIGHNGTTISADSVYQANGNVKRRREKVKSAASVKHSVIENVVNLNSDVSFSYNVPQETKPNGPDKRRKVVVGANVRHGYEEKGSQSASEARMANGNASIVHNQKLPNANDLQARQCSVAPAFDARKLLIEKARTEIRKQLEKIKLCLESTGASAKESATAQDEGGQLESEASKRADSNVSGQQLEPRKTVPVSITVPDPDFHDFDKDRSEECFKPKQIWALYDEEDGMPRLYCLIREIISIKPFKIHITYLNSKTDTEFGSVNWLDSGFTKSCGNFRAWNSDVTDQVNIFSHVLNREKAGRGGCVRIYPKSGDIWAVYRNWSRNWNRATPAQVRHQYEMVEVLDDYSEELGVCVTPLIKLAGFKTVYQSDMDKTAIRWIPRREMLRFSHQVPSWLLKGELANLPEKCWDLDPAATPDELLHAATESNAL
ncbi:DnaJ domain containing protein [Quillaja saponaria]|uniref:DnaJ domain containing protein n=1 Tax=Quillaja saponaria TaxID=32244 RepID=A0AAD7LX39_QUISA|nr:DnaJ domain containing protein [Quillaja saponaria]